MKVITAFCFLMASVVNCYPDEPATNQQLSVIVDLVDGSRINGSPEASSVPLETSFGKMSIPLERIRRGDFRDDRRTVELTLINGDKLTGTWSGEKFGLQALFGKISIPAELMSGVSVSTRGPAAAGLLFWNTMESERDVKNGRIGAKGKFVAGKFADGKFGKGLSVDFTQGVAAVFPVDGIPARKGCMELWVKLAGVPQGITDGAGPMLFGVFRKETPMLTLSFCNNDGFSGGGLLGYVYGTRCNTGGFGGWTFDRALGAGTEQEWHHYALVWDLDGIKGVDDGTKKTAVFLDGKLNGKMWHQALLENPGDLKGSELRIMHEQTIRQGSAVLDNLKVWDYPKIKFDDRFIE